MIKHANFQAVEYVIVTGGNGQVRKKGDMTYVIDDFEVASEKTDFSFINSNDYAEKLVEAQSKAGYDAATECGVYPW